MRATVTSQRIGEDTSLSRPVKHLHGLKWLDFHEGSLPTTKRHHLVLSAFDAPTLVIHVHFADQASKVYCAYRDKYGLGASAMKSESGNIYDSHSRLVGRISYNGRIWDADGRLVEVGRWEMQSDVCAR